MHNFRELARAVALGDWQGANIVLDLIARDGFDDSDFSDLQDAEVAFRNQIELGRSDAAAIRSRDKVESVKLAA